MLIFGCKASGQCVVNEYQGMKKCVRAHLWESLRQTAIVGLSRVSRALHDDVCKTQGPSGNIAPWNFKTINF